MRVDRLLHPAASLRTGSTTLLSQLIGFQFKMSFALLSKVFRGPLVGIQNQAHRPRQSPPLTGLLRQLLASLRRQRIETCLAVVLARTALRLDPLFLLQSLQRRIQRSMVNKKNIL